MTRRGAGQAALGFDDAPIGDIERTMARRGRTVVIGVDEVGRGPLAGPVTVAGVALDLTDLGWCEGLDDSKKLTAETREALADRVRAHARDLEVVRMPPDEVDRLNVLAASLEGMRRAAAALCERLGLDPTDVVVLVDGNKPMPGWPGPQQPLVKGDGRSWAIAAASVVAKVHRDAEMCRHDATWPAYGFAQHKGYPTPAHLAALRAHGATPIHRRSFRPVAEVLEDATS